MYTIFNSKSVWSGTDLKTFNEIRDTLEKNEIKYKYNIKNLIGSWTTNGTVQGRSWTYDIIVMKTDYDNAMYFIGQ